MNVTPEQIRKAAGIVERLQAAGARPWSVDVDANRVSLCMEPDREAMNVLLCAMSDPTTRFYNNLYSVDGRISGVRVHAFCNRSAMQPMGVREAEAAAEGGA